VGVAEVEVLTFVLEGHAAPQACENVEPFVEHGGTDLRIALIAEVVELGGADS
jgi:hypothetical protein